MAGLEPSSSLPSHPAAPSKKGGHSLGKLMGNQALGLHDLI